MALDSALHFLDELKDKYMHEVEKAIEDWDYQDFSPDKRTPLLENEVTNDIADDLGPEPNALQQIKDPQQLNWSGLSPDAELASQDYGAALAADATATASYEARVVTLATPNGGIQGLPDVDMIRRVLAKAPQMSPRLVADAFAARLQESAWQVRSKALVLMELLLETPETRTAYLEAFARHATIVTLVDGLRRGDHNPIARENARKVLSLIRSNGTDAAAVAREHVGPKPHVRHVPTEKKKPTESTKPTQQPPKRLHVQTLAPKKTPQQHHYQATSPRIAAAALASWRRRSQKELLAAGKEPSNLMPFQRPTMDLYSNKFQLKDDPAPVPAPSSPSIRTSGAANASNARYASGNLTGFSFLQPPAPTQTISFR